MARRFAGPHVEVPVPITDRAEVLAEGVATGSWQLGYVHPVTGRRAQLTTSPLSPPLEVDGCLVAVYPEREPGALVFLEAACAPFALTPAEADRAEGLLASWEAAGPAPCNASPTRAISTP